MPADKLTRVALSGTYRNAQVTVVWEDNGQGLWIITMSSPNFLQSRVTNQPRLKNSAPTWTASKQLLEKFWSRP